MLFALSLSLVLFLAYANGANDNFKGVATLYGCGVTNYKGALRWTTLTTLLGALAAVFLAATLLKAFSGKELVPDSVVILKSFSLSVALAAALTVMIATFCSCPISTTHALTGGLVGAGFLASNQGVHLEKLLDSFLVPLLLSPFLAFIVATLFFALLKSFLSPDSVWIKRIHFLSSGTVCFARALNDTPKIAAILLVSAELSSELAISLVAFSMALGGIIHSKKIAETLSHRVTSMNEAQGLLANMTTGVLVIGASRLGLPVSTTHVACGSLFGIGTYTQQADYKVIRSIILSWVMTLPVSALLGAFSFWCLNQLSF